MSTGHWYYNGPLVEFGHAGPWPVPWGQACDSKIRFAIFHWTGVMVSLRSRLQGKPKEMSVAGNRERLSEAYWLACAIGQNDHLWDLMPHLLAEANNDVRGGCPKWLHHPGRVRPWSTLENQPQLVGWTWVRLHDGRWIIAPPVRPPQPLPPPPPPPADDGAALPTADDLQPTAALPTADEPTADDLQQNAADHEALPTVIPLPQADVADAGAGPPSQLRQPQSQHCNRSRSSIRTSGFTGYRITS